MENTQKMQFRGKGGDLFVIFLTNFLLTLVTMGIYKFWAKVNVLKFMHKNTSVHDGEFDYHGTGAEAFAGFLKGMLILGGLGIIWALILAGLTLLLGENIGTALGVMLLYAGIFLLQPLIILGKRRYKMSRTSWSNVRFSFNGQIKPFMKLYFVGALLCGLTFGIYTPWWMCDLNRFYADHTRFGNRKFLFTGSGDTYWKPFIGGYLLTLITCGIYSFWWTASLERYYWQHSSFGSLKFESKLTGAGVLGNTLVNLLLIVFTLGIGLPWAIINNTKFYFDNLELQGDPGLEDIVGGLDQGASALADGVAEAGEALEQVADVLGG